MVVLPVVVMLLLLELGLVRRRLVGIRGRGMVRRRVCRLPRRRRRKKTKAADSTPAEKAETGAGTGAKKTAAKSTAKKSEFEPLPTVDPARPRTKLTAKCSRGRGGATVSFRGSSKAGSRSSQTPAASTEHPEPTRAPRTKETAKCSRGRGGATASSRGGISDSCGFN